MTCINNPRPVSEQPDIFLGRYPTAANTLRARLNLVLSLLVLFAAAPAMAQFAGGDGSVEDPWQVATAQQLNEVRNNLSAHYILTADIDLTDVTREGGAFANGSRGWMPIGSWNAPFQGSFNGSGYTLLGLFINANGTGYSTEVGLFSAAAGATLIDIALEEVEIYGFFDIGGLVGEIGDNTTIARSHVSGAVKGEGRVGALVGTINGSGSTITDSFATASVSAEETPGGSDGVVAGGLVGDMAVIDVSIVNSYATGNVTGGSNVGGLIGRVSRGSIVNSYATGAVNGGSNAGGLVGYLNTGTITNSYAMGPVDGDDNVGGLVGSVASWANASAVTNAYWNTETSGQQNSPRGTGLTSAQMRQQAVFTGFDFTSAWQIQEALAFPTLQSIPQSPPPGLLAVPGAPTINGPSVAATNVVPRPALVWTDATPETPSHFELQVSINADFSAPVVNEANLTDPEYAFAADLEPLETYYWRVRAVNAAGDSAWSQASFTTMAFAAGDGSAGDPWQVATAAHLNAIRNNLGAHFTLNADIDLTAATGDASGVFWNDGAGWQSIGDNVNRFTGSLDGNGFAITGLHIDRPDEDYVGLFGYVAGASITGVAIESGSVSGGSNVGALAGILAQDSVLTDSHAKANVSGTGSRIGGLVGSNYWGTITNSHAIGNVDGGDTYIGGLAGSNDSEIFDSYATGNVTGTSRVGGLVGESSDIVTRSYATGDVTATGDLVGGLIGDNLWKVDDSYATGNVVGAYSVGGLTGRNSWGEVNNSYATGSVAGDANVGGLVGVNENSDVINSYWNTDTTGQESSAGSDNSYGLTSAQMRQQASFGGFDFDTIWQIQEAAGYPVLRGNLQDPPPGLTVPDMPSMSSPANEAFAVSRRPVLEWGAGSVMADAYNLQISANADFSDPIVDVSDLNATQYTVASDLDPGVTVYWRVQSVNAAGAGPWKEGQFITVLFQSGEGTEVAPWQISTAAQLDQMRYNLDAHYMLVADIDLTAATGSASGDFWNEGKGWQSIGADVNRFTGSLDGNGFAITGLHIDRPDEDHVGLFGYLAGASITGVAIESGSVSGGSNVGVLAGSSDSGLIRNSYTTGSVVGVENVGGLTGRNVQGNVNNSYVTASVTGQTNVGGLVGINEASEITSSYASGRVTGAASAGGLVGLSVDGTDIVSAVTSSYWNTETTGQNSSDGSDSSFGLSSEQMRQQASFGGFDFDAIWQIQETAGYPVLRSNLPDTLPGLAPPAPLMSSPANDAAAVSLRPVLAWSAGFVPTDSYNLQISTNADFSDPIVDLTDSSATQYTMTSDLDPAMTVYWRIQGTNAAGTGNWTEGQFTTLLFQLGDGTEGTPWQVSTAAQLDQIRYHLHAHYSLAADIDLSAATGDASGDLWNEGKGWQPIGNSANPFTGSLNGNGHTITGLHIVRPDEPYVGLFGRVAGGSFTSVAIEGGSVTGGTYVGALVGYLDGFAPANFGLITDSHSTTNITGTNNRIGGLVGSNEDGIIRNSYATGNVNGSGSHVGGLAGSNFWEVIDSSASGDVTGGETNIGGLLGGNYAKVLDSFATGSVIGKDNVGGLIGYSFGQENLVSRSYATGNVTASGDMAGGLVGYNLNFSAIEHSYATGSVAGVESVGGLTGRNYYANVRDSYAAGDVTGETFVGGLIGRNSSSEVTNSYWNTETTGQENSAGSDSSNGLTSAQMRQQASFSGFDFDAIWQIAESTAYPVLRNNTQSPAPGQVALPPPVQPSPGVISSENQGGVFNGDVTINPGGVLNGGQVTGTVQNNGEITGDVTLGANTVINGGTVSGNISGNSSQPARINGARITSGASLNNVVIGNNAELDPDVQLGPNVRFTSPSSIPPGIDLTNALPSHNWAGGDGRSVPDLSGDVLTPVDDVSPASTLDAIRVPEGFEQGQARQDSESGELIIISGNLRATVVPGRVRQSSPDQEEGVFISEDGDLVLITANGREITSQPVVADRERFSNVLGELGLESQFGSNASLRLTNPDTGSDNAGFLSVRPEALSFPATAAEEEGLYFRAVPGLNGASVAIMVYLDEEGNLMQQDLVPVPSDWQSLKSNLTSIEGLNEVRIDTQGIISVSVDGQPVRGQMQYEVTQGGFDDDVPAEGSVLLPAGDINGDGTDDFRVVYADGSSQLMLIFATPPRQ